MKVHLKSIQAHELHSRPYDGLKLEDLNEAVTLVYAPNAAGKTVLALAASRALRPGVLDPTDRITGSIQVGEITHQVNLRGPRQDAPWPQSSRDGLYRLSIPDIIVKPAEQDEQRILEALAGGVNLAGVGAGTAGRRPNEIAAAWQELNERQQKAARLAEEEARLPELENQLSEAKQARADAALLSQWGSANALERAIGEIDAAVAQIKQQYVGIENQSDDAPALVTGANSAYEEACETHVLAAGSLEEFGNQKAPRPLQATDEAVLSAFEAEYDQLSGELTTRQHQQEGALSAAQQTKKKLDDMRAGAAPVPLRPADKQTLFGLVEQVKQAGESAAKERQRREEAQIARNNAQRNYKDAGGDPEQLPANAPKPDDLHRAVELDALIAAKRIEHNNLEASLEEAQTALERARERLPGTKAPARQVTDDLLKEPKLASLMDEYRKAHVRREAFDRVAEQLEKEADTAEERAAGAREAETALKDWLRFTSAPPQPSRTGPLFIVATVAIAGALATGAVAGWIWGTLLGVCGIVALLVLAMRNRAVSPATELQEPASRRVPAQWQPQSWTCDGVASSLASAIQQIQKAEVLRRLHGEEHAAAGAVDIESPRNQLRTRIALLQEETGIEEQTLADYNLANAIHYLQALRTAEDGFALASTRSSKARTDLDSLTEARSNLIHETIGAAASITTGAAAKLWADRLDALRQAEAAYKALEESARSRESENANAERALRDFYERFHWPSTGDLAIGRDQFIKWFEATEAADASASALNLAGDQVTKVSGRLKDVENAIQELLARYGFPRANGKSRTETGAFREWFETTARLNRAQVTVARAKESLERALSENGIPAVMEEKELALQDRQLECQRRAKDALPKLRDLSKQRETQDRERMRLRGQTKWDELFGRLGLESEPPPAAVSGKQEELLKQADRETEIADKIAGTRALIRAAESANDLQGAQDAMSRAVGQMESWLRRKQDELAGAEVVSCISEAVRAEATPVIVRNTNQYLSDMTNGRYDGIDIVADQVCVTDRLESEQKKRVDQLSTGTRVHLALALRLAAIEASEANQGYTFPLLLDEVMATSDPDASTAIASALKIIAEKRQVIMFTNQPDDLNIMRRAFGDGLPVRTLCHAVVPVVTPPIAAPPLRPQNITDGLIPLSSSVSQWPPQLLAGLLDDLDGTRRTVFEAMACSDQGRRARNETVLAAVEAVRSKVAAACRMLDRSALSAVDWITPAFRERVEKLLDDVGGDPRRFLEGFRRMDRMRSVNIEACERWLAEQSYLSDVPTPDEVRELASGKLPADLPGREDVISRICGLFVRYAA